MKLQIVENIFYVYLYLSILSISVTSDTRLQGERERAQQMIADMRLRQESEQALKEEELSTAQAQLMARQQEAEQQGSRLKEAAVSFWHG